MPGNGRDWTVLVVEMNIAAYTATADWMTAGGSCSRVPCPMGDDDRRCVVCFDAAIQQMQRLQMIREFTTSSTCSGFGSTPSDCFSVFRMRHFHVGDLLGVVP